MIQRKQTIFLLLAAVCLLVAALVGTGVPYLWLPCVVGALVAVANVMLYRRRPLQANLCVALIGLFVCYYVAIGVYQHAAGGQLVLTWPMALPALAIVFLFMARKGILKDEKLVKSLDRIR